MKKAKIISIINYKGGVGKTVSAFNIAAGLNFLNQNKVLLIDLDPQCSLSTICTKAYGRTIGQPDFSLSQFKESETINSVFKTYLNGDILDFKYQIKLEGLIKKDFYSDNRGQLKGFDFIPSTMYMNSRDGFIKGLDSVESDIKARYGEDLNGAVKRTRILADFFMKNKIHEMYDFIIIDCPPSNNLIVQNAIFISDFYLVPTIMDDMSTQGVHHVKYIIEETLIQAICKEYKSLIELAPSDSYLSFLKNGVPKMIGIFETLRRGSKIAGRISSEISRDFPGKLFDPYIPHQVRVQEHISSGISFFSEDSKSKNDPIYQEYNKIVLELLSRINSDTSI